ncbi:TetR/AcrR family transcriptional regulator [Nocardia sp. NPDC127526]|uniref:TetR/AcrR family transcriptional regulator n=1 Tax=Nocardia sp. NPDC127526 TaxID=3345393 RepID=UPI00363D795E
MASTDTQPSTRQDRRKARTRGVILDAAEELFAGGDAVTVEQIAEAADVAIATIYQHFGGKDPLYLAVVERALEANERHMVAIYESDAEPVDRLIEAAGAYLRFFLESPHLFRMIQLQPGHLAADQAATLVAERINRMNAALVALITDGIREGSLRKVGAVDTARFLWGTMNGVIGLATRPDALRLSTSELRATTLQGMELLLEGLLTDRHRGADGRVARRVRLRLKRVVEAATDLPQADSPQPKPEPTAPRRRGRTTA